MSAFRERMARPRWRNGLIGAALASLTGLLFWWSTFLGQGLTDLSYDLLFLFRENMKAEGITILYMDPDSDARLDQLRHAVWDRRVHAGLLARLKELHAKAVAFDVVFPKTDGDPAADQLLVEKAREFGKAVFAAKPTPDVVEAEFYGKPLAKPFPDLADVAPWGMVEAIDSQQYIRKHYCRGDYKHDAPCIASALAQVTESNAPPESTEPRWLNYYGPPRTIRHYSYFQIFLTNQIPPAHISNQVVFVGGLYDIGPSAGRRADDCMTPYTRHTGMKSAGVEVVATAYLNLIHNTWLRRPSEATEAAGILFLGWILGLALAPLRPLVSVAAGLGAALAIGVLASWSAWHSLVWFPWMIPIAVQIPAAVGWSVLAHTTRLAREKRSLEQALALASRGAVEPDGASPQPSAASSSASDNRPGSRFDPTVRGPGSGRSTIPDHELLRCIGKGAYGEVWLARDIIGTFHAVKVVRRGAFADAAPLEREFNGIRKFTPISRSHPGFVHILHVGRNEPGGYIYYVMEIGDDETQGQTIDPQTYSPLTLAKVLENRGRLPLAECLDLCIQLSDALDYLHRQNLIHRDIKPSNIIFVKGVPKFADIGLVTDVATHGRDVTYLGTPGRIAPEGPGSPSSDVYSLGKIIYEAGLGLDLTRFPELPTELVQSGDDAALFQLNRIILKACESDVRRRHPSAAALREDLLVLQKSLPVGKAKG